MIAAISDLAWMQALGWTLIHFLWQGAIVGINFAMVRRLVPSEQSSLRYAFGLFSLFALVMAPVLTLALLWPSGGLEAVQANDSIIVNASLASSVTAANATSTFESLLPVLVVAWLAGVCAARRTRAGVGEYRHANPHRLAEAGDPVADGRGCRISTPAAGTDPGP